MILKKTKTKLFAVLTAFTMAVAVTVSLRETISVNADIPGTTYYKYTYTNKQLSEYMISSIPEYDISGQNSISTFSEDRRELAPLEKAVVSIKCFTPTGNEGYYSMSLGTGFIIGDHEIMTAAHVVFDEGFGNTPSIEIANSNPQNDDSIALTPIAAHVPQLYEHTERLETYDYAIITVEEDLSDYGKALLGVPTNEAIDNHIPVHNLGYAFYNNINCALKIDDGVISESISNGTCLISNVLSYGGTSGGPVYVETDYSDLDGSNKVTYKTVIGVISCGNADANITTCSQIRPEILKFAYNNSNL